MEHHLPHKAVVHLQAAQIQVDNERGFAQLVCEQRLCVLNAAPCELVHVMESQLFSNLNSIKNYRSI